MKISNECFGDNKYKHRIEYCKIPSLLLFQASLGQSTAVKRGPRFQEFRFIERYIELYSSKVLLN
jgi:hypothetical protein